MQKRSLICVESASDLSACVGIQSEYITWIEKMLLRKHARRLSADSIHQIKNEVTTDWPLYSGRLGRFYIAYVDRYVGGMAGIRHASKDVCELKRLYVSAVYRRAGLGKSLVQRLLADARILGYSKVRLETLDFMLEAIGLYESLGFIRGSEFESTEGRSHGFHEHEIYFTFFL